MRVEVEVAIPSCAYDRFKVTVPDYFSAGCGISFRMSRGEARELLDQIKKAMEDEDYAEEL